MEHLGSVVTSTQRGIAVEGGVAYKLEIYGEKGSPTVYGLTRNTVSVIKMAGIDTILASDHKVVASPVRAKSSLALAHGLNIELGGKMSDLINLIKKTESLYLVNKISEQGSKTLWGITRMGAGSLNAYSVGSILSVDDKIIKVTPNHQLRKDEEYRAHVPLTSLNVLTLKADYKKDGYTNRYLQVILGMAKPMRWSIVGIVEKTETSVSIKVRTEVGDYNYSFSLDRDEPELLRLASVYLLEP